MDPQRLFGIVLLVLGAILLFVGMNSSQSLGEQVSQTFTGRFSERTTWYLIGGIVAGLLGVLLLFVNVRGRAA